MDYYLILGVNRQASLSEIKKAYRMKALEHHPDHNPNDTSATEWFQKLNEAYEILGDRKKDKRMMNGWGIHREAGRKKKVMIPIMDGVMTANAFMLLRNQYVP